MTEGWDEWLGEKEQVIQLRITDRSQVVKISGTNAGF